MFYSGNCVCFIMKVGGPNTVHFRAARRVLKRRGCFYSRVTKKEGGGAYIFICVCVSMCRNLKNKMTWFTQII